MMITEEVMMHLAAATGVDDSTLKLANLYPAGYKTHFGQVGDGHSKTGMASVDGEWMITGCAGRLSGEQPYGTRHALPHVMVALII